MKRTRQKSQLDYKHMEPRLLLAGDVTVVENGDLYIRGDELSNQIKLSALTAVKSSSEGSTTQRSMEAQTPSKLPELST